MKGWVAQGAGAPTLDLYQMPLHFGCSGFLLATVVVGKVLFFGLRKTLSASYQELRQFTAAQDLRS